MSIKYLILLVLILLLHSSCGHKKTKDVQSGTNYEGVALSKDDDRTKPDIHDDLLNPSDEFGQDSERQKKRVIGLFLGPALYHSVAYVSILKSLAREDISISVVTGIGLSAVMAAMVAVKMSPEEIEWRFHKFLQKAKKTKIYSKKWQRIAEEELLARFSEKMNVQDTKLVLSIPVYDKTLNRVVYVTRGKLLPLLKANLALHGDFVDKYSSAIEWNFAKPFNATDLGVDVMVFINALKSRFHFLLEEDYLLGVYGRASGVIQKNFRSDRYVYQEILSNDIALDDIDSVPTLIDLNLAVGENLAGKLKNKI